MEQGNDVTSTDGYDSAHTLIVHIGEYSKEWILDSSFSFHMCPNKRWFETLDIAEAGSVLLGNNKLGVQSSWIGDHST